jgi:hypothetical protein
MAMEEEFSTPEHAVSIPDEDADSIKTVQDAIDYIRNLGSGNKFKSSGTPDNSNISNVCANKKRSLINKFFKHRRSK